MERTLAKITAAQGCIDRRNEQKIASQIPFQREVVSETKGVGLGPGMTARKTWEIGFDVDRPLHHHKTAVTNNLEVTKDESGMNSIKIPVHSSQIRSYQKKKEKKMLTNPEICE